MACRRALAQAAGADQTNLPVKFHGIDPKPSLQPQEEQSGRFLHRPQQAYPAATVADFCTAGRNCRELQRLVISGRYPRRL